MQYELQIPPRLDGAMTGSEFIESIKDIPFDSGPDLTRRRAYVREFLTGNIPDFLRNLVPVRMGTVTIFVMPDFLAIGSDEDFVRVPMCGLTAQEILDIWGGRMPTKAEAKAIYRVAKHKLALRAMVPPKYPRNHSMMWTSRYALHNKWIQDKDTFVLGELADGHKKNVILAQWLETVRYKKVGVFGGYTSDGRPIHDFYTHSHADTYKDYSHGIRCVLLWVLMDDGSWERADKILCDPNKFKLLTDEFAPYKFARYPIS
jgi:hypothetical protein